MSGTYIICGELWLYRGLAESGPPPAMATSLRCTAAWDPRNQDLIGTSFRDGEAWVYAMGVQPPGLGSIGVRVLHVGRPRGRV